MIALCNCRDIELAMTEAREWRVMKVMHSISSIDAMPDFPPSPGPADVMHEDAIGYETLRRMASVEQYNRWIYEELAPYAGQRILEVGCGIGNMTAFFLEQELIVAIDRLSSSVQYTSERFENRSNVVVMEGDISDPALPPRLRSFRIDTVLCVNVLEHIEDDVTALRHMWEVLRPGGRLLLLVPAGQYMFGMLDEALGHFRRYERSQLARRVSMAGFHPIRLTYMNIAGIPGWLFNSRVLKRNLLPKGQLRLFNALTPLFIWSERMLRRWWDAPFGQSLVCIAEKRPDRGMVRPG